MDILKSSNVERILFDMFGAERTKALMLQLDNDKYYKLTTEELAKVQEIFAADFCSDQEGLDYIKQAFEVNYLMCPHTATCFKVYDTQRQDKTIKTIAYATAEWTKFSPNIALAITGEKPEHDKEALEMIAGKAGVQVPEQIASLFSKEITQKTIVDKTEIDNAILDFLNQ
jgi:threonine synthase